MLEIRDAILAGDTAALAGTKVPESYRGVVVRKDEQAMFDGHGLARQGPAAQPARRRGADPRARARARRSSRSWRRR